MLPHFLSFLVCLALSFQPLICMMRSVLQWKLSPLVRKRKNVLDYAEGETYDSKVAEVLKSESGL